jgi:insulysin
MLNLRTAVWISCFSCTIYNSILISEEITTPFTQIENEVQYPLLTPTLQERQTAKIELKNGLQVYLISDPGIDQSAASMSVEAGSWQDSDEYPGTAHFLEHMLFMGNGAYPDESEYMQYIQDNGGLVNAFTASDRTVYMFSINNDAFLGALDRFSHFFIDPLFNPSCIQRELQAVDQENSKNLENDNWREYMVFKETGNPKHPNRKFSTGNAKTLSGIPQDVLKSWYQSHYSSDSMHLILLSHLPLDQMISQAVNCFSSIEKRDVVRADFSSEPLLSDEQKGHFIYIKPIKDLKNLSLTWELPKQFAQTREKWTAELVAYALEQASDQSLVQTLKKEGLIESLSASSDRFSKDNMLFTITIKLTDQGLSQIDTVVLRCFQAMSRYAQNGLSLSLFQEIQTMAQIDYQYQSRQEPFSWISTLAYEIVDEDLSTFPERSRVPQEFNPESISQFFKALTPQSCTYFVIADPAKISIDNLSQEKWFGVEYRIDAIPPSKLIALEQATPYPSIQNPPLNPYVLTSLPVLEDSASPNKEVVPKLLADSDRCKIYFATDTSYLVPEATLLFRVKTPALNGSAKSFALMELFLKSLKEDLASTLFFAAKGGLSSSFSYKAMQLSLQVMGYSEKAPDLAKALFSKFRNLEVSEEQFKQYKTSLGTLYANSSYELPVKQAHELLASTLLNDAPTPQDKLKALETVSLEEFSSFCKEWASQIFVEGMLYGNLTENQAEAFTTNLQEELNSYKPYLAKDRKKQEILLLPKEQGPFKMLQTTDRQGYAALLAIQEGPFSFAKKASQQVLSKALQEAFFKTLRTQQQTGYIAQSVPSEIENQLLHTFAVQSSSHTGEDLLSRFEIFLSDFTKRLSEIISEERFDQLKKAQITTLEMPPENLFFMAQRLESLAFDYDGDFERMTKRIEAVKSLEYAEFIKDVNLFLAKENSQRLAILVKGENPAGKPFQYQEITAEQLESLGTFTSGTN